MAIAVFGVCLQAVDYERCNWGPEQVRESAGNHFEVAGGTKHVRENRLQGACMNLPHIFEK